MSWGFFCQGDITPRYPTLPTIVLIGSIPRHLRPISYSSFSRLMAYEAARILHTIGCHVRTYDPLGLPVKDDTQHDHPKVQELRQLSEWSDGQFWCSPEQHGNVTAVFKNQSEYDACFCSAGVVKVALG